MQADVPTHLFHAKYDGKPQFAFTNIRAQAISIKIKYSCQLGWVVYVCSKDVVQPRTNSFSKHFATVCV